MEKRFGDVQVLRDISFTLDKGQSLAVIGSSGSGKTTLLRCLNFLERPDGGTIAVGGRTLFDAADSAARSEEQIRRSRLHFGLVFQSFNLFPQYTALDNVMLARTLLAREEPDYKSRRREITEAIRWHTTGKGHMTLLEKVIYLADYIEPTRDFPGVAELRKRCYENLDAGLLLGLEMTIREMEERGAPIHPKTLEARDALKGQR